MIVPRIVNNDLTGACLVRDGAIVVAANEGCFAR